MEEEDDDAPEVTSARVPGDDEDQAGSSAGAAPLVMTPEEFERAGGTYHEPASAGGGSGGEAPLIMTPEEFEQAGGKYHEPEQSQRSDKKVEAEGVVGSFVRDVAHGLIPTAAAVVGAGAGGVVGGLPGAIVGGFGVGAMASAAQEQLLHAVGFDDSEQLAANQREHPIATGLGSVAAALPAFGSRGAPAAARLLAGGIGGGVDLMMSGDPVHAGAVAVGSAALGGPRELGSTLLRAGEGAAAKVGFKGEGLSTTLAKGMAEKESATNTQAEAEAQAKDTTGASSVDPAGDTAATRNQSQGGPRTAGSAEEPHVTPGDERVSVTPGAKDSGPTRDNPGPDSRFAKDAAQHMKEGVFQARPAGEIDEAVAAALKPKEAAAAGRAPDDTVTQEVGGRPPADAPTPSWLAANRNEAVTKLQGTPVGKTIEDMARQGKTAAEIEAATGADKDSIRAYRDHLGIEAAGPAKSISGVDMSRVREGQPPSTLTKEGRAAADINKATADAVGGKPVQQAQQQQQQPLSPGQRAVNAAAKYSTLAKQGQQQPLAGGGGGPTKRPPPPPGAQPPNTAGGGGPPKGPNQARLNQPPLHESAPNTLWNRAKSYFAPEFMSPASNVAGEALGRHRGRLQALDDKWTGALEKHYPAVEAEIKAGNGKQLMDVLEGQKNYPNYKVPTNLEPLVRDVKAMNEEYKEAVARHAQDPDAVRTWNAQHLPHLYSDFEKAQGLLERTGGSGVRGSGGSLNEREYQSYFDAEKNKGLTPKYANPLDALKAYRTELGKFLGNRDAIQEMRDKGALKFANPEPRVGGSGQFGTQGGGRIHPDWEAVRNLTMGGRQGHMPRDAAHVFNNYLDPGWRGNPFYNIGREVNNRLTQIELGLFNGFHAFVVGNESMLSNMGRGISEMAKGDFAGGAKTIAKSPAAAYTNYAEGRRGLSAVTGQENRFSRARPLTEEDRAIVRAAQDAGVMPSGRGMAPDVNMGGGENLWKSYMRDSFGREMHELGQRIKDNPLKGVPVETWNMIGRTMQTMSEPLFGHYIPALKFGTLIEDARSFIKQTGIDIRTPQAQQEINQFMRKQRNAIDNRLGEMNRDMMFMNGMARDAGYLTMRSMSWFLGTAKALGGGYGGVMKDVVNSRGNPKELGRMLAEKLDMTHKNYDPNFAYAVAFPFGIAFMGAVYQFLHTGATTGKPELPDTSSAGALFRDLTTPRTGGKIPGFAGKGKVDERVMLPGYHRDLFGWMHDPKQEAYNKQNVVLSTAEEELGGRDSFGRPFVRPNATLLENALDRMKYAGSKILPFAARNLFTESPKKGTGLTTAERALGFRSAGTQYTDPEALGKFLANKYRQEYGAKQRSDARAAAGGVRAPAPKVPKNTGSYNEGGPVRRYAEGGPVEKEEDKNPWKIHNTQNHERGLGHEDSKGSEFLDPDREDLRTPVYDHSGKHYEDEA